MAKISMSFDTVSKELSVEVDGVAVADCTGINIFPSWDDEDEYRCSIMTCKEDEANDMRILTNLVAHKQEGSRSSLQYPGFMEASPQSASAKLSDLFGRD